MKKNSTNRDVEKLVAAALVEAGKKPWHNISLSQLARRTKMSMAQVQKSVATMDDLLPHIYVELGRRFLDKTPTDVTSDNQRDRLFEILMLLGDTLNEHRAAYLSLFKYLQSNPKLALRLAPHYLHTTTAMTEIVLGKRSRTKTAAATLIIGAVTAALMRVWITDHSPDLARSMAFIDRTLKQVEWMTTRLRADG